MKKISLFLLIILSGFILLAQERSVSGKITEKGSDSGLSGANLIVYDYTKNPIVYQGISGRDGNFILRGLPADKLYLSVSYLGCRFIIQEIDLTNSDLQMMAISLESSPVQVGEVLVSALRQDKMLKDVSLPLAVVNRNHIDNSPALTPANLFGNIPGVSISRDGIWATSINIRGMSEQRIVSLVDGNRIETATDLAAGLSMIDINDIERIEVIKGAASSLYGTGAMGGVVNIITRKGHYHDKFTVGGSVGGMYQAVNKLNSEYFAVDLSDQQWYVRLSASYRDAGNTMTPAGELLNSQFTDNSISFKAGARPFKNHEISINYQTFNAKDVGIPGGTAFPVGARAIYPAENRNLFSASYIIKKSKGALQNISFKYFNQYILRDVLLEPNAAVKITPSGYHATNGFQVQTNWKLSDYSQLIAGMDLWQRHLSTEREKTVVKPVTDTAGNVTGSATTIRGEIPIPDARFTSGGIFIQDQLTFLENRLVLTIGGRFDIINTRNNRAVDPSYLVVAGVRNNNPSNQRITFNANDINNYSWSLDAGLLYHPLPNADLTLTMAKSFRAPSIEERFKYIDLGSFVRLGDPNLKPEQGYFFDMGTRIWKNNLQVNANAFVNSMTNLIVESPGIFVYNYSASETNFDTLSALINTNVTKAILYGVDLSVDYNLYKGLSVKALGSYARGRDIQMESDLPQIPPLNGQLSIRYRLAGIFSTEFCANFSSKQDKIAAGETNSKAYSTYDFGIQSSAVKIFFTELEIFGGIQNLTNKEYMNHLSTNRGIIKFEPGRNFYLKILLSF